MIAEGHGSHVTDVSGRDFIDYHLGSGPALLGHAHPEIIEAVQRQVAKGSTHSRYWMCHMIPWPVRRVVRILHNGGPARDRT